MTTAPRGSQDAVLGEYADGVRAIASLAAGLEDAPWDARACGEWTAAQLARHVLAVAE